MITAVTRMMNISGTNQLGKVRVKSLKPRAGPDLNPDPDPNLHIRSGLLTSGCAMHANTKAYYE